MIISIFFILLGASLLYLGAESLVKGASRLAIRFGIAPLIVGLTVVAIATSMPEATASLIAQIKGGKGEIALGNIIGSNIANISLVLGLVLLVTPLPILRSISRREMPILIFATAILMIFMLGGSISRKESSALLIFLLAFLFYQVYVHKKSDIPRKIDKNGLLLPSILLLLGIILLAAGGNLFIDSAVKFASLLGIEEKIVGLTIVAIGTSAPELTTSLVAAIRKKSDLAIGNIIGSNILNICFVGGSVALYKPIVFDANKFTFDAILMLCLSIFLWTITFKKSISRKYGVILLAIYIPYLFFLYMK